MITVQHESKAAQTAHAAHTVALYSTVYGQALLEGGAAGLVMAVDNILEHPIQTTLTVAAGEYMFAYQLSKLTYNLLDLGITALVNTELAQEKLNAYIDPINRIIAAINDKETTFRDVVKIGAALTVCWQAQSKILQGCGILYRSARDKAVEFINNNPFVNPEQYMATPEGMLSKFSFEQENANKTGRRIIGNTGERLGKLSEEAFQEALNYIKIDNNFHHYFQDKHKLDSLVKIFGNRENVMIAVINAVENKLPTSGVFLNIPISIEGYTVLVRGRVMGGVPKFSTIFIP